MEKKIQKLFKQSQIDNYISNDEYVKYSVKKGLRNEDGTGVLIGLTRIADVVGYKMVNGVKSDTDGELLYRGIKLTDIANHMNNDGIYGYEEIAFLILFGHLPNKDELNVFSRTIRENYNLKPDFLNLKVLSNPCNNVMNKIQTALLAMYEEDENPDNPDVENVLRQGLNIISKLPSIVCYAYESKHHDIDGGSLIIHHMDINKSIAENILSLLRYDQNYTQEEAELLDTMLVIHMDHGAGNNSTFANIVVSSTDTDLYSCISAAVGSLKGPRHGGANIKALKMMEAVINEIGLEASDSQIEDIIYRLLNKDFFDKSGLIYGLGHAVYTLSDPRSEILKKKVKELLKDNIEKFDFYIRFEEVAKKVIKKEKGKTVSANVDFYSGIVYSMLGIPQDLFTPMFVCARVVGWIAHNIENKLYCNRIIRPAGKYVGDEKQYIELEKR